MAKEVKKNESTESMDLTVLSGIEGIGSGFEGTNSGTFKTTFLKVLQATSPEL